MLAVLLRRLLNIIPTVGAVILVIFLLFSVIPGSFTSTGAEDGRMLDPQVMERMRKEMGLDDPILERFGRYVGPTLVGDLGKSFRTREPVATIPFSPRTETRSGGSGEVIPVTFTGFGVPAHALGR